MALRSLRRDDRGITSPLGYLINLGIFFAIMTSLTLIGATYMDANTDVVKENRMESNGQQLSRTIQLIDRLVRQSGSGGEIGQVASLAPEAAGTAYKIQIVNESDAINDDPNVAYADDCNRQCMVLFTNSKDVKTVVYYDTETEVNTTTFRAGAVYVVRESGDSRISFQADL